MRNHLLEKSFVTKYWDYVDIDHLLGVQALGAGR